MTDTKALEVSIIARKAAYDYLQVLDDDEDVISNFHDHHENVLAARFQTAIDEATRAEQAMCDRLAEALGKYGDKNNYDGYYASGVRLTGNHEVKQGVFVAKPWDLAHETLATYTAHKKGR